MQVFVCNIEEFEILPASSGDARLERVTKQIVIRISQFRPFYARVQTWIAIQIELAMFGVSKIEHYEDYLAMEAHQAFKDITVNYVEDDVEIPQLIIQYDEPLIQRLLEERRIRDQFKYVTEHCRLMIDNAKWVLQRIEELTYESCVNYDEELNHFKPYMTSTFAREPEVGDMEKKKVRWEADV